MTNSADPDQLASTDLNLHCLLRQDMSCSAREGLGIVDNNSDIIMIKYPVLRPGLNL